MIKVESNRALKLVRVTMSGLLTEDEVRSFGQAKEDAVRDMGLKSGEYLMLIDARGNTVHTQQVMEILADLVTHSRLKAKRIATVREGALTRLQSGRLSKLRDDYRVFDNMGEAESWLFQED
jgi:hypothetical protein